MRTARTIGIKEDGSEVIIHPASVSIVEQLATINKIATSGVPKPYVQVDHQSSDGRLRTFRNGISAALKAAEARAAEKAKNANVWHDKQKKAREESEKKAAEERQKRIDAANASKEEAKKKLLNAGKN